MAPVLRRGKLRRSEVKWLAQGHTASSGVRIQTQEAELQSPGCNDKAMPRLRLCPAAPQRHRAVHSQPPPQRLGRGQRSAVSSQQYRALGCPALPIFVFDNYLSSEQLGTSPKTDPCQRQLTNSHMSICQGEGGWGLWHRGGGGGQSVAGTISSR